MPYTKGVSGNKKGRPKGKPNKITHEIRESLQGFLETNGANFQAIFDQLEPKDKIRYYIDLLPFVIPKLQSTQLQVEDETPPVFVTLRGADDLFIETFPSDYE
jgi:hypothetical protein